MEVLCIIPARGGSEGIPRKNLIAVGGIPLIGRAVVTARLSKAIARVVVSTEDKEIANVAVKYGADVLARPECLAGNEVRTWPVLRHALDKLSEQGYDPDVLVCMQCTSPFTAAEDLDGLVDTMLSTDSQSAMTVVPDHGYQWAIDASGQPKLILPEGYTRGRRQDNPPRYRETGAAYAMIVPAPVETRPLFSGKLVLYVQPEERSLEIDDPLDLQKAEAWLPFANG